MDQKKMASARIKKIGDKYYISIPQVIVELLGFAEGDIVRVPFLAFEKVTDQEKPEQEKPEKQEEDERYELRGKTEITVKLRDHDPVTITRDDVLRLLENPEPELLKYRTAYLIWNGKRYGIKKLFATLVGYNVFNTVEGEKYLQDLGFRTDRAK